MRLVTSLLDSTVLSSKELSRYTRPVTSTSASCHGTFLSSTSIKYLEDLPWQQRNRTLVFTNLVTFALNHCTWNTQHVAKSWFFHYSVWHGGIKRCALSCCRKSTFTTCGIFLSPGIVAPTLTTSWATSFNSVCSGHMGLVLIIS